MKKDICFDIDEEIFFMKNNTVKSGKVAEIRIVKGSIAYYCVLGGGVAPSAVYVGSNSSVFATKKELIESL